MAADPSVLPNIGPRMAAWLRECGVHTASDLLDADAVTLYLRLKARRPREVTLVALWAIVGAQLSLDWRQLPPTLKEDLRAKLRVEARRSAPAPSHPARIL